MARHLHNGGETFDEIGESITEMSREFKKLKKEVDKEIVRAVIDDDELLNQSFEEIDGQSEVGQFTQDEPQEEDVEDEQV